MPALVMASYTRLLRAFAILVLSVVHCAVAHSAVNASLGFNVHRYAMSLLPGVNPSLGPNIQRYAVGSIPDVSFKLPKSWAGQIKIPNTKNDELFFWLFETENQKHGDDLIST